MKRVHTNLSRALALSLSVLLTACGGDDVSIEEPSSSPPEVSVDLGFEPGKADIPGRADMDTTPTSKDVGESPFVIQMPDGRRIESLRTVRSFTGCSSPDCMTDIEFGLRSGIMSRYEYNMRVDTHMLDDDEYEELLSLVTAQPFLDALNREDFACPIFGQDEIVRTVTIVVAFISDSGTQRRSFDVSACQESTFDETPDPFVSFMRRMEQRYEPG